jgi:hypothetical protein
LREEYRLRISENRVLRKIFGPEREEDGSWRKLRNCEFQVFTGFWFEGPKVRDHWEDRRGWADNIKTDLREIGIDGANWIRGWPIVGPGGGLL